MILKDYILSYVNSNLSDTKYEISDILRIIAKYKNISKDLLYVNLDKVNLSKNEIDKINMELDRYYIENIPLQYILGKQAFYGEEYIVDENVLIPRADTEILVDTAIKYIKKYNLKNMVDMCSGSGCIGISIAKNCDIEKVVLVDVSKKAMEVAKKNVIKNGVGKKVVPVISDLFSIFFDRDSNYGKEKYDIIVSNPPYIPTNDINRLDANVKNEPLIALDGGDDGMDFYIKILNQSQNFLKSAGFLMFEIGYDELYKIKNIISSFENYELVENLKDLNMNDRVVVCRFLQK